MTLENHKSFPVLLKIVNPSNLVLNVVLKAFSDNIELSFVKLRPRLKQKTKTNYKHFTLVFLPLYSPILSLESCRMLFRCSLERDEIPKVKEVDRVLYLVRSPESLVPSYSHGFDLLGKELLPGSFRDLTKVRISNGASSEPSDHSRPHSPSFFFFFSVT